MNKKFELILKIWIMFRIMIHNSSFIPCSNYNELMFHYEFVFSKKFNVHKPGAVSNIVSGFKDQLARHVTRSL